MKKITQYLKNQQTRFVLGGGLLSMAGSVSAANELKTLAEAVSFADLQAGVLALFGSMATIAVIILGGSVLLSKLGWRRT
jgi:hypothetical protein